MINGKKYKFQAEFIEEGTKKTKTKLTLFVFMYLFICCFDCACVFCRFIFVVDFFITLLRLLKDCMLTMAYHQKDPTFKFSKKKIKCIKNPCFKIELKFSYNHKKMQQMR